MLCVCMIAEQLMKLFLVCSFFGASFKDNVHGTHFIIATAIPIQVPPPPVHHHVASATSPTITNAAPMNQQQSHHTNRYFPNGNAHNLTNKWM